MNPWLFHRSPKDELQDIIFFNLNEVISPRIHANSEYQEYIKLRIEQMIHSKFFKSANLTFENDKSVRKYKAKKAFQKSITKPIDAVYLSEEIQVISYGEDKQMFPKIHHQKTIESTKLMQPHHLVPISNQQKNRRSEMGVKIMNNLKLEDIPEKDAKSTKRDQEYEVFNSDFFLSAYCGYRCLNVRREEGTFEVFEPAIKREALEVRVNFVY